jgi:hypothetical protein
MAQTKKKKKSLAIEGGQITPNGRGVASEATPVRPIWGGQRYPMAIRPKLKKNKNKKSLAVEGG